MDMMYNTSADTSRALLLSTYYMTFCLDQRMVFILMKLYLFVAATGYNTSGINTEIKVNGQKLETVTRFKYLGSVITDEGSKPEILSRIEQTTAALTGLKPCRKIVVFPFFFFTPLALM